ncbi:hypothetical protein GOODEAATRI_020782 [Goodea atripinnis]|uniref:Uncharacterized protein n=1 Tax=Goodea atripinnis TaxID=208336 RepID=A0ABV0NLX2_9TELE
MGNIFKDIFVLLKNNEISPYPWDFMLYAFHPLAILYFVYSFQAASVLSLPAYSLFCAFYWFCYTLVHLFTLYFVSPLSVLVFILIVFIFPVLRLLGFTYCVVGSGSTVPLFFHPLVAISP